MGKSKLKITILLKVEIGCYWCFWNDEKDGDVKNTIVANYLILFGDFDFENDDNVEFESYEEEIRKDKYRNDKNYKSFKSRGIDKDKI